MTLQEQFQISGSVAFTGIAIVFIILVLLIGVISVFALITRINSKPEKGEEIFPDADYATQDEEADTDVIVSNTYADNSQDDTELVAVIMAAITATMGAGNGFRLRSIRRSGRNTSAWNLSGRDEYLATRL